MSKVAILSLHTSPLVQPGTGDAGGMNVYIRELATSLSQAGTEVNVFVRRWDDNLPEVVEVASGFKVTHIKAGPTSLAMGALPCVVDEFSEQVSRHLMADPVDVLHANYWLSGIAGHRLKHELGLPLVATFHTLARVKAETGDAEPQLRVDAEMEVIRCSDVITANSVSEQHELVSHYGAQPDRIEVVPPGVNQSCFSAGSKQEARRELGLAEGPLLLFVGRIQPLKGADVAVEALAELCETDFNGTSGNQDEPTGPRLMIVGGPSGNNGDREVAKLERLIANRGLSDRVKIIEPQPHQQLVRYYRAADVCLVPSRSESFGLVALEAAACGVPVVASDVGGLRILVEHGRSGFRIASREPADFAAAAAAILKSPWLAAELSRNAVMSARAYTWTTMAGRLRRVYDDIDAKVPVDCI